MSLAEIAALAASLTALVGVAGLILLPSQRKKLIAETGNLDTQREKMYSEMGLNALRAALEEALRKVEELKKEVSEVQSSAEKERRASDRRIVQLLDAIRETEDRIRQRDMLIVRLGGDPPVD